MKWFCCSGEQYEENKFVLCAFVGQVTVTGFQGVEDLYGILVNITARHSAYVFPLCDLKAENQISTNYRLTDDYAVWFANR